MVVTYHLTESRDAMTSHASNRFGHAAAASLSLGKGTQERLSAWRAVVELAEESLAHDPTDSTPTACGPGCGTCCAINVEILEPEALAIAEYVQQTFSAAHRAKLSTDLATLHQETRWLDDEERMMVRKACAFLDPQQNCSIHPVRPLLCRSISSTDPGQCREAIAMLALGEPPQIICNLNQKQLFNTAYLGLATALEEYGCDHNSYRLAGLLSEHIDN